NLLLAASWTTILPLVETVAVSGIRRGALDYGKVRLWGSLSSIVASFGSSAGSALRPPLPSSSAAPRSSWASISCHTRWPERRMSLRPAALEPFRRLKASPCAAIPAVPARSEPDPIEPRALVQLRQSQLARAGHLRRHDRRALVSRCPRR